ncbi:transposase [Membranihabitans marinus]|uniref:transposase n=1 Tax=Membranihabitans marinus TaxID=1227546 RepID=UPI001F20F6E8|nr:transposase [Membranihabitans marinus]
MSNYNPEKHHRRSIRLKGYDYAQEGLYFITLCCQNRLHLFGVIDNGKMELNSYGIIANQEWLNSPIIRKNIQFHEFIIMPNHIHGIIEILYQEKRRSNQDIGKFKSPSQTIGAIIRGYKIATIKRIKDYIKTRASTGELQFARTKQFAPREKDIAEEIIKLDYKIWQRNYYEHIIKTARAYNNISNYIINNPRNWKEDKLNK